MQKIYYITNNFEVTEKIYVFVTATCSKNRSFRGKCDRTGAVHTRVIAVQG